MSENPVAEKKECFSITQTITNFAGFTSGARESPTERHFDIDWYLHVTAVSSPEFMLSLRNDVEKLGELQNRIHIEASFWYLSRTESKIFDSGRVKLAQIGYVYHRITMQNFKNNMIDGSVKIRCDVKLFYTFPPPKLDFQTPSDEVISDVVLIVEGREFKVSKVMLASVSPYFQNMFFEKFREAKDPIIPLEDVDADEFQELLDVIYHKTDITLNNARELLQLVNYFNMKNIKDKCEQALLAPSDPPISLKRKLLLADRYALPELLEHCVFSFQTIKELRDATPKTQLSPLTTAKLFQRVLELSYQ